MRKKRILFVIGGIFAAAGIISLTICIVQQGENKLLLSLGIMCNSLASLLLCLTHKMQ